MMPSSSPAAANSSLSLPEAEQARRKPAPTRSRWTSFERVGSGWWRSLSPGRCSSLASAGPGSSLSSQQSRHSSPTRSDPSRSTRARSQTSSLATNSHQHLAATPRRRFSPGSCGKDGVASGQGSLATSRGALASSYGRRSDRRYESRHDEGHLIAATAIPAPSQGVRAAARPTLVHRYASVSNSPERIRAATVHTSMLGFGPMAWLALSIVGS